FLERRQQVLEQAALLGRGGRGDGDEARLCLNRNEREAKKDGQKHSDQTHGSSPLMKAAASAEPGCRKNRSTGARSTRRPWWMNSTSSPRRRAWPRLCVAMTTFVPAASKARMSASISRVAAGSRLAV